MTKPVLTDDEVTARLAASDWTRAGDTIVRELEFRDFADVIRFVNRVAEVAETYNHHPDMLVHGWNKLQLILTNHAAGGLTELDFEMAARFDALLGDA